MTKSKLPDAQELRALIAEATDEDLSDGGRYFADSCSDLTQCRHQEIGEYQRCDDGRLIEWLWNHRAKIADVLESHSPAPDKDEGMLRRITHILEKWDVTEPPDACTGQYWDEIAADILSALAQPTAQPSGDAVLAQTMAESVGLVWARLPEKHDIVCGHGMPEGCREYWRDLAALARPKDVVLREVLPGRRAEIEGLRAVLERARDWLVHENKPTRPAETKTYERLIAKIDAALASPPVEGGE